MAALEATLVVDLACELGAEPKISVANGLRVEVAMHDRTSYGVRERTGAGWRGCALCQGAA